MSEQVNINIPFPINCPERCRNLLQLVHPQADNLWECLACGRKFLEQDGHYIGILLDPLAWKAATERKKEKPC